MSEIVLLVVVAAVVGVAWVKRDVLLAKGKAALDKLKKSA